MNYQHVYLIVNPAAGQPKPILHAVNKVFHEHAVDWEVLVTTAKLNGAQLARQAVEEGCDLVIACGGDGTVKEVINGMIGSNIPLGLLHGGTGNALAYRLGIPQDIEQAAALIVGDHTLKPLDVGKVVTDAQPDDVDYFTLRAGVGIQQQILQAASRDLKDRFGNFAYVLAGLQSLSEVEQNTHRYHLTIDDEQIDVNGFTCMVVNCAAVGGANNFEFAPNVDPFDGQLDVFVIDADFQSLMAMLNSMISGNAESYKQRWHGRKVRVEVDGQQNVAVDGEPFGEAPFTAEIVSQAVEVIVPRAKKDQPT